MFDRVASDCRMPAKMSAMKSRLLFALFFLSLGLDLLLAGARLDWRVLPAAIAGWYLADLVSGLVHMYMDYRPCIPGTGLRELYFWEGSRDTPEFLAKQDEVYGRISRIRTARLRFQEASSDAGPVGAAQLVAPHEGAGIRHHAAGFARPQCRFSTGSGAGWLLIGVVVLLLGSSMTQGFHGTLHREDVGPVICVMRRLGLLMTASSHKYHHDTLTRDFSVISGWSNPVVNVATSFLLRVGALRSEGLEPT